MIKVNFGETRAERRRFERIMRKAAQRVAKLPPEEREGFWRRLREEAARL